MLGFLKGSTESIMKNVESKMGHYGRFIARILRCTFFQSLTLVFVFPLFVRSQEAPPVFDWQSSLGGSSYDAAAKVVNATDGGYIVVGTTYSNNGDVSGNHGSGDVWVVKLSPTGVKQWKIALGGNG